jgi:electron transfer flavoprotein beta subunit
MPADLGVDVSDLDGALTLESLYETEAESDATYFEGDASETAAQLGDLLEEKGVIEG